MLKTEGVALLNCCSSFKKKIIFSLLVATECPAPPEGQNVIVTVTNKLEGKWLPMPEATYRCINGLVVVPGTTYVFTCNEDRSWPHTEAPTTCMRGCRFFFNYVLFELASSEFCLFSCFGSILLLRFLQNYHIVDCYCIVF